MKGLQSKHGGISQRYENAMYDCCCCCTMFFHTLLHGTLYSAHTGRLLFHLSQKDDLQFFMVVGSRRLSIYSKYPGIKLLRCWQSRLFTPRRPQALCIHCTTAETRQLVHRLRGRRPLELSMQCKLPMTGPKRLRNVANMCTKLSRV